MTTKTRKTKAKTARRRPAARAATQAGAAAASSAKSRAALAAVRRICLALTDSEEKIAWGAPTFRVRGRLFVMFVDNHHGDGRLAIWCNAAPGAQDALVATDATSFFVPPYVGPSGWVGVRLDRRLKWPAIADRIEAAHRATLETIAARREGARGRSRR